MYLLPIPYFISTEFLDLSLDELPCTIHTCMALMAEAVLATAPKILAMITVSDVMGCMLQFVVGALKLAIDEFAPGTCDALTEPPHDPPAEVWSKVRLGKLVLVVSPLGQSESSVTNWRV